MNRLALTRTLGLICVFFVLASCKREARTFRALPPHAVATPTTMAAALRPGGAPPVTIIRELPAAEPIDLNDAEVIAEGQKLFHEMNCAGCHSSGGGGGIGPALSDEKWIYGWQPAIIFQTIIDGRPNGMPAFGGKIPDSEAWKLVAYVRSLSGLGSRQWAPGRSDHMAAGTPPNSVPAATPRIDATQVERLRDRERDAFHSRGWIDPQSGDAIIPDAMIDAVTKASTRPSSQPTTAAIRKSMAD